MIQHLQDYREKYRQPIVLSKASVIKQILRLRIKSVSATSGPPIGPVLGQYAIPISKFCTEFNERSAIFHDAVEVFVTLYNYEDGSYTFDVAIPISSICFRRAATIRKGSSKPN
jgi:large subunit ribosomal protein L11